MNKDVGTFVEGHEAEQEAQFVHPAYRSLYGTSCGLHDSLTLVQFCWHEDEQVTFFCPSYVCGLQRAPLVFPAALPARPQFRFLIGTALFSACTTTKHGVG